MTNKTKHQYLTHFIALVWLINGLICKALNFVPRHQQIVGRILGEEHAETLTILIGAAEILMAIWILTRFKPRLNAITQILVIATMNILEFILVPDLLLWGHLNSLFALIFIGIIYYHEFVLRRELMSL